MKLIFTLAIILLLSTISFAQSFTLNTGGAYTKGYFITLPYRDMMGKIVIEVELGGKKRNFILDTGAPDVITQALYNQLRPTVIARRPVVDANHHSDTTLIVETSQLLGDVNFNNVPAIVTATPLLFGCFSIDGFIGSNLLRNSIVQISPAEKKVYITDDDTKLSLDKKTSIVMTTDLVQSIPFIKIDERNQQKGDDEVMFDSGSDEFYAIALSHYYVFAAHNLYSNVTNGYGSSSFGLNGAGNDTAQHRVTIPVVTIANCPFKNVLAQTTAGADSRLGTQLLNYGAVTVDYLHKRFYFQPFNKPYQQKNRWPFTPTLKDGKFVVGTIWDNALQDSIHIGDQVVAINNMDIEKLDVCSFLQTWPALTESNDAVFIIQDNAGKRHTITTANNTVAQ